MAQLKTKPNDQSVEIYLNSIEPQKKREDSFAILKLMQEITGEEPQMWGDSITGKSCLYIKKLEDINEDILRELIKQSVDHMRESNLGH